MKFPLDKYSILPRENKELPSENPNRLKGVVVQGWEEAPWDHLRKPRKGTNGYKWEGALWMAPSPITIFPYQSLNYSYNFQD